MIMIYCFLADGFEELEAIAPIDILKRANFCVKTAGVGKKTVTGTHGLSIVCDTTADAVSPSDELEAVILPGGMPGTLGLDSSEEVHAVIDYAAKKGCLICAICAAPSILGKKGLLEGKNAIAFPGFEKELRGAVISDSHVVRDGNFITAKGAGVAIDFGLEIVSALAGEEKSREIRKQIQCR